MIELGHISGANNHADGLAKIKKNEELDRVFMTGKMKRTAVK